MAAENMLRSTSPALQQDPVKFVRIRNVYISLLITAGVPSVVAAESDDGLEVADTGTGRYTVSNLPSAGAERCVANGGAIEGPSSTFAASAVCHNALDLEAGTIEINTLQGTTLADPTTLSKVRYKLELAMR